MTKVKLVADVQTYTVTVVNKSTWAYVSETSYIGIRGTTVEIPLTMLNGSDSTCITVDHGTLNSNSITVPIANSDVTVKITDTKYRVSVDNEDSEGISAITPAYQFVSKLSNATFSITYNSGYNASSCKCSEGTLNGNTLTVQALKPDTTVMMAPLLHDVSLFNDIKWVTTESSIYKVRHGRSYTIPISYTDNATYSCLQAKMQMGSSSNTIDASSSGIYISSVTDDATVILLPAKAQVKVYIKTPVITSIGSQIQYAPFNSQASFTLYYASGFSGSDVVTDVGTVSSSTLTVPTTSDRYATVNLTDRLVYHKVGYNNSYDYNLPYRSRSSYSISEQIYTASEIKRSGTIRGIGFYNRTSYTQNKNLRVYMTTTSKNSFSTNSDWTTFSSGSYKYYGSVSLKSGWNYIMFSSSYNYDGNSNLMVYVNDYTGGNTSYLEFSIYASPTYDYQAISAYRSWSSYDPSYSYDGSRNTSKNWITLIFDPS